MLSLGYKHVATSRITLRETGRQHLMYEYLTVYRRTDGTLYCFSTRTKDGYYTGRRTKVDIKRTARKQESYAIAGLGVRTIAHKSTVTAE